MKAVTIMLAPVVVDFMITGQCNLDCPFCYGPDPKDEAALSLAQVRALIDFLGMQGIEGIVVAGGEPTLSSLLPAALSIARQNSMWLALQTNATRPRVLWECLPYLDWLALPFDAVSRDIGRYMRTSPNHALVVQRIAGSPQVRARRSNGLALKIGTVLTPANLDEIDDIAKIVNSLKPDVWKIYQLRPRGAGRLRSQELTVEDGEFHEVVERIQRLFPEQSVVGSLARASIGAYLVINPDSSLLVPMRDRYRSYGKLIDDKCVVDGTVWCSAVEDLQLLGLQENVELSFPIMNPYNGKPFQDSAHRTSASQRRVIPVEVFDRDGR